GNQRVWRGPYAVPIDRPVLLLHLLTERSHAGRHDISEGVRSQPSQGQVPRPLGADRKRTECRVAEPERALRGEIGQGTAGHVWRRIRDVDIAAHRLCTPDKQQGTQQHGRQTRYRNQCSTHRLTLCKDLALACFAAQWYVTSAVASA